MAAEDRNAKYLNPELPLDERVADLIPRMSLEEKVSQMMYAAPGIPRLEIQEHNWWSECIHGVAKAGNATVFPQCIGMASSFDPDLLYKVATAISVEARAKHHEFARQGDRTLHKGLTFFSPNINILRDPRWGRCQETYGEDPYLTSRMAVAFVKGLQGDDPRYLRVVATAKHFAAHSGPEAFRHNFDSRVSEKDLRETYLPAFKSCVVEGKVASIMAAYNRLNGEPCSVSERLLTKILRDEWGFDGYVASDCDSILDIHTYYPVPTSTAHWAALALKNGCEMNCGRIYVHLMAALKEKLIAEKDIDRALARLMRIRMRLGMFDPPERVSYTKIPYEKVNCDEHRDLALAIARESIVLVKNENRILPLSKNLKAIAVIGPNADDVNALSGNYTPLPTGDYHALPFQYTTVIQGIRKQVSPETRVLFARGCDWINEADNKWGLKPTSAFAEALAAAERADVVVMCLGLTSELEGEQGQQSRSEWEGDRHGIALPRVQQMLLEAVATKGKPMVLVLLGGGPVTCSWAQDNLPGIIVGWYPGELGGQAVAEVLFGDCNPSGKLPVTFVKSVDQLPLYTDYGMTGRTYRYLKEEPLYPFGFGLSYTRYEYSNLRLGGDTIKLGQPIEVTADVENTGKRAGDEIVELYLSDLEASVAIPTHELKGFKRVHLEPGERQSVSFTLQPRQMALINEEGQCILEPGKYRVYVGGCQPDARSKQLGGAQVLSGEFALVGYTIKIAY